MNIEQIILDHLLAISADLDRIKADMIEIKRSLARIDANIIKPADSFTVRFLSLEKSQAQLREDIALIHQRLDNQDRRIDRIERRLEGRDE